MKSLLRQLLVNMAALWTTAQILPGLQLTGGFQTLLIGGGVFMLINIIVVPLLKVMFLPLNLLTFGFFTWVINVLALYFLTNIVSEIKLVPYLFAGANFGLVVVPMIDLNTLQVAIISSFLIGLISNLVKWLMK
jgi:putative membrane protein